jgi:chemotaxis protein MotB
MRTRNTSMLLIGLVALAGCTAFKDHPSSHIKQPTVCVDKGWYGYYQGSGCPSTTKVTAPDAAQEMAARLAALERDRQRLADELEAARRENGALSDRVSDLERQLGERDREIAALRSGSGDNVALSSQLAAARGDLSQSQDEKDRLAAELAEAKQRNADLEGQLAERDQELTGLRGDLSAEMAKLKEAERGLIRSLGPQIKKGDITVHLNDERLLINLASGYLFASGHDQLKPAGTDALKQVGAILKDYPEYKVAVDGHTDNQPIGGALKKKFPTNMELSEARAVNAARALEEGGLSNATTQGYAETKPKAPNTTEGGRAKNRRVEVRVTK